MKRAKSGEVLSPSFSGARIRPPRGLCPPAASPAPQMIPLPPSVTISLARERLDRNSTFSAAPSVFQLCDCDRLAAAILHFRADAINKWMRRQKLRKPASKCPRAISVDDSH